MSGNLWMFSDKLDDEDIEIMKHEFITYYQGADYYGLGLKMFTRLAHEAGAVYKIGKKVLIRRTIFDEYLRQQYHIEQMASLAADGKEASTRQGIQNMANALKMTLYGTLGSGTSVPLTDAELIAFVNSLSCNDTRKHIVTTALSLVGKVPYFWGGKSEAGWNDEWNTPKLVTIIAGKTTEDAWHNREQGLGWFHKSTKLCPRKLCR